MKRAEYLRLFNAYMECLLVTSHIGPLDAAAKAHWNTLGIGYTFLEMEELFSDVNVNDYLKVAKDVYSKPPVEEILEILYICGSSLNKVELQKLYLEFHHHTAGLTPEYIMPYHRLMRVHARYCADRAYVAHPPL